MVISPISINKNHFSASSLAAPAAAGLHSVPTAQETICGTGPHSQSRGQRPTYSVRRLIIDGTFGVTQPHQLLFPTMTNVKVGLDTLGIPGTNIGALPWSGGMPDFDIAGYPSSTGTTFGYSYPPLEYKDPVFEYTANVTKIKGSHNIRVGEDIVRLHMNHKEVRNTVFQFTGGVTSLPGGASPNAYNGVADFLLGLPQTTNNWFQPVQPYITLRE